jgi:hypothetical protein
MWLYNLRAIGAPCDGIDSQVNPGSLGAVEIPYVCYMSGTLGTGNLSKTIELAFLGDETSAGVRRFQINYILADCSCRDFQMRGTLGLARGLKAQAHSEQYQDWERKK